MISMSGAFSVTFSVIFAYVADVTTEHERSTAYGLVRLQTCLPKGHFVALTFWYLSIELNRRVLAFSM